MTPIDVIVLLKIFKYENKQDYCINTGALPSINGNKSGVLIMELSRARAVNARLIIMLVTKGHAKHMQNYLFLNWARIMHGF